MSDQLSSGPGPSALRAAEASADEVAAAPAGEHGASAAASTQPEGPHDQDWWSEADSLAVQESAVLPEEDQ